MRILYITPYVPSKIRLRPYEFIRWLIRLGHEVTVLTAAGTGELLDVEALRGQGIAVEAFPVSRYRALANCARALPLGDPLQAHYAYSPQMAQRVAQATASGAYDVVHIEHLRAARHVAAVQMRPVIYDSVDCISLLFELTAQTSPIWRARQMARLDLKRTQRYEARLMEHFDAVVVSSGRDRDALLNLNRRLGSSSEGAAPVTIISNGVDLAYFRPDAAYGERSPDTVVFTGKISYHANVAGVLFFAQEVLPRLWALKPEIRFKVVGKDPPAEVRRLASDPRIEVTGYVDDLRPHLATAAVAVCPVPYAVGIQNKVLEAMAMATPVIASPASATGLMAEPQRDLLIADAPADMAEAVLRVLSDRALAARLGTAGRRYVETNHNWEVSAQKLIAVYEQAQGV